MPDQVPTLVLATSNAGKVAELEAMLDGLYSVKRRPEALAETIEDQDTLELNALKKAREVARFTGESALADDSGLFVDALKGAPGVHTARFAGDHCSPDDNIDKLLRELANVTQQKRTATFRTVIAVVNPAGEVLVAQGEVAGKITADRRGTNGFGYDPIFAPIEGTGLTFAEMSKEQKRGFSHRSRAFNLLVRQMESR